MPPYSQIVNRGLSVMTQSTRRSNELIVNSTHGQLDTCVELTHLPKSQLDTSQLETGVNSTHGQLDTTRHIYVNLKALYSAI